MYKVGGLVLTKEKMRGKGKEEEGVLYRRSRRRRRQKKKVIGYKNNKAKKGKKMPIACAFRNESLCPITLSQVHRCNLSSLGALLFLSCIHHSSTFVIITSNQTANQPTKGINSKRKKNRICHAEDRTPSPHIQTACVST